MKNLLTKNNPWGSKQFCTDKGCQICQTRAYMAEETKAARSKGEKMPSNMAPSSSTLCRREGCTYVAQCLGCLQGGVSSCYREESSRSSRQRTQEHNHDVDGGLASSPLVNHIVEVHGGTKQRFLYTISKIEHRPLYRAVLEAVQIANQPSGPRNLNRCQEWGRPRVPILVASGGDEGETAAASALPANPRPEWTLDTLTRMGEGSVKRVRYWNGMDQAEEKPTKRSRRASPARSEVQLQLQVQVQEETVAAAADVVVVAKDDGEVVQRAQVDIDLGLDKELWNLKENLQVEKEPEKLKVQDETVVVVMVAKDDGELVQRAQVDVDLGLDKEVGKQKENLDKEPEKLKEERQGPRERRAVVQGTIKFGSTDVRVKKGLIRVDRNDDLATTPDVDPAPAAPTPSVPTPGCRKNQKSQKEPKVKPKSRGSIEGPSSVPGSTAKGPKGPKDPKQGQGKGPGSGSRTRTLSFMDRWLSKPEARTPDRRTGDSRVTNGPGPRGGCFSVKKETFQFPCKTRFLRHTSSSTLASCRQQR